MEPGTLLWGRYLILRRLGRGGMGAVYLCEDQRLPGKTWAVKELVCPDPARLEAARKAFQREVMMLSGLRHRNLPLIVDCFSEGERDYLVLEAIEGETLARQIEDQGPADEVQALRWGLEIARVLEYLHSQKPPIIFRDLKPENVMVEPAGHIKVIDFGLARHFDPGRRDSQPLGSVGYAAPEQWEDPGATDARSDIYSLGATLYYILLGKPPSPVYGTHRLRQERPDISPQTEALVLRCMEAAPEKRYQTAAEVIHDMMHILSRRGQPAPTPPEPPPQPPLARDSGPPSQGWKPAGARAASVPRWLEPVLLVATLLFLAGVILGFRGTGGRPGPTLAPPEFSLDDPAKAEARRLMAQGDYTRAVALLDGLVTRRPSDAEAHILKQNAYALLIRQPTVRLAALLSLTGVDGPEAGRILHGLAQAQAEVNERAGLRGRPVVIDIYDDGSATERCLELAQKITADPAYLVCIGAYNSQRTLAVAPIFNAARMPLVTPVASDTRIWEAGPYIFSAGDSHYPRVHILVQWALAQGYRKAAVLKDPDNVLSESLAGYFRDQYEGRGGKVVLELPYTADEEQFSSQVQALKSSPAQVVFFGDYRGTLVGRFARALRSAGSTLPLACQVGPFTRGVLEAAGPDAEGIVLSGYFHPDIERPAVRQFVYRFHQLFGTLTPSHLEATAYDVASLVLEGLEQGLSNRQKVRDYLASRPPYEGVSGRFALARRLDARRVYLIEIRQGTYHLQPRPAGG